MYIESNKNLNFDNFYFSVNSKEINQINDFLKKHNLLLMKHIESKKNKQKK